MILESWVDNFSDMVRTPPNSLWFILLVSLAVSLFSTLLNKLLVDHNQLNRQQAVISEHQKWKKELTKMAEENPKRYAKEYPKFQRRDKSIQKMQQSMSLKRMKPTCITFIPLIVFFYVVRNIYTAESGIQLPVAAPPMNPMDDFPYFIVRMAQSELYSVFFNITIDTGFLGFTGYYILCSITLSSIMQKLFGIQKSMQGGTGGMSQMFDSSAQMELPKPK